MDLVFAEEKYSKSGQLEKVRQHFGNDPSPYLDGSNNPKKRNHISLLATVFIEVGELRVYLKLVVKCHTITVCVTSHVKCCFLLRYIHIYIQDCLRKLEYCDKVLYFL